MIEFIVTINPLVGIVTLLAEEVDVLGKLSFHVVEVLILILLIVEILSEFLKRGGHELEGIYELQRSDGEAQELLVVVWNRTEASLLTKLAINLVGSSDDSDCRSFASCASRPGGSGWRNS